ncbi:hypothetical protein JL720_5657 [Aureococcus anophagefferens]|nr:hypothetical protein JL720_5657 [Aureococcus anophagefferens]
MFDMAYIVGLVDTLREGDDAAKAEAAQMLGEIAYDDMHQNLIAEAGGIPPLVELLRDGSAEAKSDAANTLRNLADNNAANKVLIVEAGGIPPLVELLRNWYAKQQAAWALQNLARNNDANAVAIAVVAVGFEALIQLARGGRVSVDNGRGGELFVVYDAGVHAKRKAALVVATLLRDSVPEFKSAPDDIKAAIGSYL